MRLLFKSTVRGVALWTLTFPGRITDWPIASYKWRLFRYRVLRIFPGGFPGIRVAEWHPGGHGWHIHYLTTAYARVEAVRGAAQMAGFGRVNVLWLGRRADGMAAYLAKHFRKDFYLSCAKSHGQRKWACMGGFKGTTTRNIEVESSFKTWLYLRTGGRRCKPERFKQLWREWLVGPPVVPYLRPERLNPIPADPIGPDCPF